MLSSAPAAHADTGDVVITYVDASGVTVGAQDLPFADSPAECITLNIPSQTATVDVNNLTDQSIAYDEDGTCTPPSAPPLGASRAPARAATSATSAGTSGEHTIGDFTFASYGYYNKPSGSYRIVVNGGG